MNTPLTLDERLREATVPCYLCKNTGRLRNDLAVGNILIAERKRAGIARGRMAELLNVKVHKIENLEYGLHHWTDEMIAAYRRQLEAR